MQAVIKINMSLSTEKITQLENFDRKSLSPTTLSKARRSSREITRANFFGYGTFYWPYIINVLLTLVKPIL